jgi:hypothetical protein
MVQTAVLSSTAETALSRITQRLEEFMRFLNLLFAAIYGTSAVRQLHAAIFDQDTVQGFLAGLPSAALMAGIAVVFLFTAHILGTPAHSRQDLPIVLNYAVIAAVLIAGILGPAILIYITGFDLVAGLIGLVNAIKLSKDLGGSSRGGKQ